jgi:hypothetical protein
MLLTHPKVTQLVKQLCEFIEWQYFFNYLHELPLLEPTLSHFDPLRNFTSYFRHKIIFNIVLV